MPWDKVGGMCVGAKGPGSIYGISVFIVDGGGEAVITKADGSIPDPYQHTGENGNPVLLPVKAALLLKWSDKWNSGEPCVQASKLYLDFSPNTAAPLQEYIWKRMFISLGAVGANDLTYGGQVTITVNGLNNVSAINQALESGLTSVDVQIGTGPGGNSLGHLHFEPANGNANPSLSERILKTGPGYSEVAALQDCSQSVWTDGDWSFAPTGKGTLGRFCWYAPAARPADDHPAIG